MKKVKQCILASLFSLSFIVLNSSSFAGGPSGALCLYVNGQGEIVCVSYGNSGVQSEADCYATARADTCVCGNNMGQVNIDAGSCASSIFIRPDRCIDIDSPHGELGYFNQGDCESNNGRWCASTSYGFFVGNSTCQDAICAAASLTLPVELIDLRVEYNEEGDYNHITWSTASEYNSSHFTISSFADSISGESFQFNVPAAGMSSNKLDYAARHQFPQKKTNYYYLTQVDINGKEEVFGPISINNFEGGKRLIKVVNMMGQEVDESYEGIVIEIYHDGSTRKRYGL